MHLRAIVPTVGDDSLEDRQVEVQHWASSDTKVDVVRISRGTASIESSYDESLAGPGILSAVNEAIETGVDGVFITCFGDPGVQAAREIADFPVVGGFEPAVYTALSLGDQIGVVTVLPNVVPMIRSLARRCGVDDRLGGIAAVNVPVVDLHRSHDALVEKLYVAAAEMVSNGDADVIVLGCTRMLGVARAVQDRLEAAGSFVPVVDPTAASIGWLETSVRLGLRPSRIAYMSPPSKSRIP
jgi:allantoin racemase